MVKTRAWIQLLLEYIIIVKICITYHDKKENLNLDIPTHPKWVMLCLNAKG